MSKSQCSTTLWIWSWGIYWRTSSVSKLARKHRFHLPIKSSAEKRSSLLQWNLMRAHIRPSRVLKTSTRMKTRTTLKFISWSSCALKLIWPRRAINFTLRVRLANKILRELCRNLAWSKIKSSWRSKASRMKECVSCDETGYWSL